MSGFEIAGIVLAAIPFVITTLEKTISGIKKRTDNYRELKQLHRSLCVERMSLENIYGRLPENLVPPEQIPILTSIHPDMMAAWRDDGLRQRIEGLLGEAFILFKEALENIQISMDELKELLDLKDGKELPRQARRNFFVLGRHHFLREKLDYRKVIGTIQVDVSMLDSSLKCAIAEEPRRRARSHGRLMDLVREASSNIYCALRSSFLCVSGCTHQVHLGLEARSSDVARKGDKILNENLDFQLAVNYTVFNKGTDTWNSSCTQILWKGLLMQTLQADLMLRTVPIHCQPSHNQGAQGTALSTQQNSIQITPNGGQTTTTQLQIPSPNSARPAINLCKEIRAGSKSKDIPCYGIIADSTANSTGFQVYPQTNSDGEECSTISLHRILQAGDNGLPYIDKLHLAAKIAWSFLQLHSTPWLPENLNSRHILFIQKGGAVNFEQAFVMRSFPEAGSGSLDSFSSDHGVALQCLGLVLLELEFSETIENLRRKFSTTPRSDYSAGVSRMLKLSGDAVIDRMIRSKIWDHNYGEVVKLCMNGQLGMPIDLSNKALRQEIYERIVQPLESDLKHLQLRTMTRNV